MNTKLSISLLLAGNAAYLAAEQAKPNIVYIMTDQQSYQMLSCAGNSNLSTPAMDKLANRGYRFNKTYCVNPVSVPSRFALLTGHYGSEVGVRYNAAPVDKEKLEPLLQENAMGHLFRKGGYETLFAGKIHSPMANNKGTLKERMDKNYGFDYYCEDDGMEMAKETAEILLKRKKEEKPLLMYVSLMNPHDVNFFWNPSILAHTEKPKNMTQREWETLNSVANAQTKMPEAEYKKQIPPLAKNFAPTSDEPTMDGDQKFIDKERLGFYSWVYHRLTEKVDAEINVVLEALEKSEISDNTIIVFTSDHGDMNGSHQLIMKNRFYEEAARVPFVFVGPGIKKGVVDNETVACNGMDLIPTLCDFAGISKPNSLTGQSLKPLLTGKSKKLDRNYLFIENTVGFMVMDGRYKYAMYDGTGRTELLVDNQLDPLETQNLAYKESASTVKKRLRSELEKWMADRNLQLDPTITKFPKDKKKKE
jgi:arylsulfatase A-like enzyme